MTNVSFSSTKLEDKYRPAKTMNLMLHMEQISFVVDSLDLHDN